MNKVPPLTRLGMQLLNMEALEETQLPNTGLPTTGRKHDTAYAWSRSRMGGWAIAQSPIMRTTVTLICLKKAGYISFTEIYKSVSPIFENRLMPNGT